MGVSDRAIGIGLGIVLGLAIVIGFVFLGSRDTIDDPSLPGAEDQPAITQPAGTPQQTQPPPATQP